MSDKTWSEMVRRIAAVYDAPELTDDEVEFILWERTAFPFDTPDRIEQQVREFMVEVTS